MADQNLLAQIAAKYGQYATANPSALNSTAGATSFLSSLAGGAGAGQNFSQQQRDEANFYRMKADLDSAGGTSNSHVNPEDLQWLSLAGQNGYGFSKDSVLENARRNVFVNNSAGAKDFDVLNQFNQGPKAWASGLNGPSFSNLADQYQSSDSVRQMGEKLGFNRQDPFAGKQIYEGDGRLRADVQQHMQANPGWQPVNTYKGEAPRLQGESQGMASPFSGPPQSFQPPPMQGAQPMQNMAAPMPMQGQTNMARPMQTPAPMRQPMQYNQPTSNFNFNAPQQSQGQMSPLMGQQSAQSPMKFTGGLLGNNPATQPGAQQPAQPSMRNRYGLLSY